MCWSQHKYNTITCTSMCGSLFLVPVCRSKQHFVPGGIEMSAVVLTCCLMFLAFSVQSPGCEKHCFKVHGTCSRCNSDIRFCVGMLLYFTARVVRSAHTVARTEGLLRKLTRNILWCTQFTSSKLIWM